MLVSLRILAPSALRGSSLLTGLGILRVGSFPAALTAAKLFPVAPLASACPVLAPRAVWPVSPHVCTSPSSQFRYLSPARLRRSDRNVNCRRLSHRVYTKETAKLIHGSARPRTSADHDLVHRHGNGCKPSDTSKHLAFHRFQFQQVRSLPCIDT